MQRKVLPFMPVQDWLMRLGDDQQQVCLLKGSAQGWDTILAWNPISTYHYAPGETKHYKDALAFVDSHTKQGHKIIGFISYNFGYGLHSIRPTAPDDLQLPFIELRAFANYLQFIDTNVDVHYTDEEFLHDAQKLSKLSLSHFEVPEISPFRTIIKRDEYAKAFQSIQHYLHEGDVFQVNFTHRLQATTSAKPRDIYCQLLNNTSADFMAYFEGSDYAIHSVSPERFIKITGSTIDTFPIKGTRPRGKNPQAEERTKQELLASTKDAAELNMITDLLRNDLGYICQAGTVKVLADREIMQHANVLHTYSHVQGKLHSQLGSFEALLRVFPGGSITGMPKKRAMEIIDELEPHQRSVYCGSIVVIDPSGDLDASIAIRTIIQKADQLVLQVGGGIVHESDEAAEYQETLDKAASLIHALGSKIVT